MTQAELAVLKKELARMEQAWKIRKRMLALKRQLDSLAAYQDHREHQVAASQNNGFYEAIRNNQFDSNVVDDPSEWDRPQQRDGSRRE